MLKLKPALVVTIQLILSLSFTNQTLAENHTPDAAQGERSYKIFCASCHGVDGKGQGPVASQLKNQPTDLTALSKNNNYQFDKKRLKTIIDGRSMPQSHGTSDMPVWGLWFTLQAMADGTLQEDDKAIEDKINTRLDDLLAYLEQIQK